MRGLLEILVPLFGLMAVGFVAVRTRILDRRGVDGLVAFVFNFSIPSLLLRSLASTVLPSDVEWSFLVAFYGGSLITYVLGAVLGRFLYRRPLAEQAIFAMGGAFANLVLMGIPITLTALGPEASLPMFLIIGFHSATFMPITVALLQADPGAAGAVDQATDRAVSPGDHGELGDASRGGRRAGRGRVWSVLADVLRNPIILGILAGVIINLTGLALPGPVDRVLELLGTAAVPCALFAVGASLAGYPLTGDVGPALALTSLKLLVHPLLVWLIAVPLLGLGGVWAAVPVLMAAMPSAVNVYLFGARYDAAPGVAARTVLLSSVGSVVTISIVLALIGV